MPWRCSQSSARLCNDNKLLHEAKAMAVQRSTAQRNVSLLIFTEKHFYLLLIELEPVMRLCGAIFCSLSPLFNYNSAIISFHVYIFILNYLEFAASPFYNKQIQNRRIIYFTLQIAASKLSHRAMQKHR